MPETFTAETLRGKILRKAISLTEGERDETYGDPLANMTMAAELKALYRKHAAGKYSPAHDEALEDALDKIARIATGGWHADNYPDAAAYIAIASECQQRAPQGWTKNIVGEVEKGWTTEEAMRADEDFPIVPPPPPPRLIREGVKVSKTPAAPPNPPNQGGGGRKPVSACRCHYLPPPPGYEPARRCKKSWFQRALREMRRDFDKHLEERIKSLMCAQDYPEDAQKPESAITDKDLSSSKNSAGATNGPRQKNREDL